MTELNKLTDLKSALIKLKEGLSESQNELDRDGTIQRFEFTFELVWKTIQEYARFKGLEVVSPRDSFRVAADLKLIEDPTLWFQFLDDRNETAHLYDEDKAKDIFERIPKFVEETEKLIKTLNF